MLIRQINITATKALHVEVFVPIDLNSAASFLTIRTEVYASSASYWKERLQAQPDKSVELGRHSPSHVAESSNPTLH